MGRTKKHEKDDEIPVGSANDRTSSMEQWIDARRAMNAHLPEALKRMGRNEWIALRMLLEEFPRDDLPSSEKSRRDSVVQRFLSKVSWNYSLVKELKALREDCEKNPNLYTRPSQSDLDKIPWRMKEFSV